MTLPAKAHIDDISCLRLIIYLCMSHIWTIVSTKRSSLYFVKPPLPGWLYLALASPSWCLSLASCSRPLLPGLPTPVAAACPLLLAEACLADPCSSLLIGPLSCRNHAIALLATTTLSPNFLLDASLVSPGRGRLSCLFGDISPLPPMVSLERGDSSLCLGTKWLP